MTRRPSSTHRRDGFTLIELSIVLVIVALLVGGVFVARDMITTSKLRNVGRSFQEYAAAYTTFKGRYGYPPGDYPRAAMFGGISGNGTYRIDQYAEQPQAWQHLALSGVIKSGPYTGVLDGGFNRFRPGVTAPGSDYANTVFIFDNFPGTSSSNAMGSRAGYSGGMWYMDNPGIMFIGVSPPTYVSTAGPNSNGIEDGAYSVQEAMLLDQKMDDGLPVSGRLVHLPTSGGTDCAWGWGNVWQTSSVGPQCTSKFYFE